MDQIQYDSLPPSCGPPNQQQAHAIPRKPISSSLSQGQVATTTKAIDPEETELDQIGLIHNRSDKSPVSRSRWRERGHAYLLWWVPEIVASILSVASLMAVVWILRVFEGRSISDNQLPDWLTPNSIIAAISTLNRVCLLVPVSSAISQEAWLWVSSKRHKAAYQSRLIDLDLSDNASRGAWGSLVLLVRARGR